MQRWVLYVVAGIVGVVLVLFTSTYQVRFNETAIVATFGRAREGSLVTEPGLHFKWPYPIQSVQKYDRRAKVLETRIENVVTADNQLVAAQVFLTWEIEDPLRFYQTLESQASAERRLIERMRSALGVFSQYRFNELLTPQAGESRLSEVERQMLASLTASSASSAGIEESYGVRPLAVGVTRFVLGEQTTEAVFERMKQTRQRLAADARSSGEAEAVRIRERARSAADTIRAFAEQRAAAIVAEGDREAAKYLAMQADDQQFAIFLRQLEALEASINTNTTIVLEALSPFNLLSQPPAPRQPQSGSPETAQGDGRDGAAATPRQDSVETETALRGPQGG